MICLIIIATAPDKEQASQEPSCSSVDPDSYVDNTGGSEGCTINDNPPLDSPSASEFDSACHCVCCTNFEIAHQPINLEKSQSQQKSFARSIQPAWYSKHPWITVCATSYKILCRVCCSANKQDLITSRPSNVPFVEGGFSNWKKALQRFSSHEKSGMHREAVSKLEAKSRANDVGSMLSKQYDTEKKNNRAMLLKLLHCIQYLARQGLSFRGHHEVSASFEGNLYQLRLLQSIDSPQLASWLKKREYISPAIVNEIITICIHNTVLRQVLVDIRAAKYFSLIADEATDVSHHEQMCIAVRWVDSSYTIHEVALGLVQLPDTKALTLFGVIKDCLLRCSLPITTCIGQAYDGTSNMSGVRNGVQALMKKEVDSCLYVHCFAHSLNLCIQDVVRKCDLLGNCIEFILHLVQLIRFSPKRLNLFESFRSEISLGNDSVLPSSLRPLCPTRWTVRHSAIDSILKNYQALLSALQVIQQGHDEYAAKARGLLMQLESFDIFFSLKLSYLVFAAAEQFSINLQAKDTTVGEGLKGANLLRSYLSSLRDEEKFSTFYGNVVKSSEGLTDDPILPRYRRAPRPLDDGAHPHRFTCPKDRYRQAYFEVLEQACGEIENRFNQSDLSVISEIESLLVDAANGQDISAIPDVLTKYNIDLGRLKTQLLMLLDTISSAFTGSVSVKRTTNVRTIAEALNQSNIVKGMLSEVDKLVQAYLTFPVTSATAERSFSALRRIKTYLRSSMTAQRLNN